MIALLRGALLASLIVTTMPMAEAQSPKPGFASDIPARIPDAPGLNDEDRGRIAMGAYAVCLVKNNRRKVEKFLAALPDDPDQAKLANQIAIDECLLSGSIKFNIAILRESLFAALYRLDLKSKMPQMQDKPIDYIAGLSEQSSDRVKRYAALMTFADCVVRKDPGASRDVILGPTASTRENAALARLMPSLSPCMPAGTTVHFNRTMLYGILAEAFYREVAAVPAESPWQTIAH